MEEKSMLDPEKAKIYQQYADTVNTNVKTVEQISQEQRDAENLQMTPTEQPPVEVEKKPETIVEEKAPVESEQEKEDRIKKAEEKATNLKKALDEERAKRKQFNESNLVLEAKIRDLESRQAPVDETIADYETELKTAKSELRSVKEDIQSLKLSEAVRVQQAQQSLIKEQEEYLEGMINDVASSLAKSGYPGFRFMAGEVTKELYAINSRDPDEAKALDNKEGWEKIYKETVYPKFKKEYEETNKQITMDKKLELKKEANLNTSPGKQPQKKEDEDPNNWSPERRYEEYKKIRGMK